MNDEKQTIMIDASSLKHISCFRKFYYMVVKGYKNKELSRWDYPMAYGSAIHKFLENYYGCKPLLDCVNAAKDYYEPYNSTVPFGPREFRYKENLLKTCIAYSEKYKREKNEDKLSTYDITLPSDDFQPLLNTKDEKTIEYKFCITLYENDKYRLVLTGTVDLVCSYRNIELLLVDHKSSSKNAEKATEYFDDYVLDIQTMLYSKVYKEQLGLDYYPPVLINGIFIKKPTAKAEKEGIFDGVEIHRSPPISYSSEQMEQFNNWFQRQVTGLKYEMDNDFKGAVENHYNLTQCKLAGQRCQYFDVCKLPLKFHASKLESSFEVKQYNPLKFR